jgi:hypothetical protein
MSDGGKGSKPRPFSVSNADYAARWDAIFGRDLPTERGCPPCHGDCNQGRNCPAKAGHGRDMTGTEPGQNGTKRDGRTT